MRLEGLRRIFAALAAGEGPPLPGAAAQAAMAPSYRPSAPGSPLFREAAVLVLVYERDGAARFPLTLRTETTKNHRGQVSLPGGAREEGETLGQTALREASEEIGVDPSLVELLGALSPLDVPVSAFRIQPFVGVCASPPRFRAQRDEVARIFEATLETFLGEAAVGVETRQLGRVAARVPFYDLGGEKVWGATAMILAEFRALLLGAAQ